jgi:GntR family transcriptional regulator/MocR family aminotransferase
VNRDDEQLDLALDRDAEVPIGVQLAWALRARIRGGALAAGQRLPALHKLADDVGVNANTIRAVYQRLEQDGLVETRHGSGTYVTGAPGDRATLAQLVAGAEQAARDARVDPRELAAALYVGGTPAAAPDPEAADRRRLRAQIAALEQALTDVLARRPDLIPRLADVPAPAPRARLLDAAGLERQRADLLRRLAAAQTALDEPPEDPAPAREKARATADPTARRGGAARKQLRTAPRPT